MKRSRRKATAWILAAVFCAAAPAGAITLNSSFETGDTSDWTTVGDVSVVDFDDFGVAPTDGTFQLLMTTDGATGAVSRADTELAMGLPNPEIRRIFRRQIRSRGESVGRRPNEGSAIQQSFDATAGDIVMFDWNFFTNESVPESTYTDFLWAYLESPSDYQEAALAHANQDPSNFFLSNSAFNEETGYHTFSFTVAETGTHTLTLGVHDVEDTFYDSGVVFDAFRLIRGPEPDTFFLVASGLLGLHWHARRRKAQRAST